ncbi:MAG TPA: arsenical pump-driving ATPase [Pirellulales bacterium]|nr:arsenical pump-driving ATPase [Pirellulales bacterium]
MDFLQTPTRNIFFTGKGGVGKTSLACATAVTLADRGEKVLLVSTDPASNLDEVLGTELGHEPTQVRGVPNLWALNIDPEAAAREYRERMVGPYRGVLPDAAVASMEEQFSGSCTIEVAAFNEFARLLGDREGTAGFDHVIFDTAPTGHTLRLMSLPSAWDGFLATNTTGASCLGPLAGLQAQQQLYRDAIQALADSSTTTLVLVSRPDADALGEAERTSQELSALRIDNQQLVVNGVFVATDKCDPVALAMELRSRETLDQIPAGLTHFVRTILPLAPRNLLGADALRAFVRGESFKPIADRPRRAAALPSLDGLLDELAAAGHGVILTMGKGGVGKTTVAAALAVALVERGFPVHLTTTDPAAHVSDAVNGDRPNLTISRIDPRAETAAYTAEVMRTAGASLDEQGKALLEEDLRSPCTEEIAVFQAFAQTVAGGEKGFVVLDTAPTGHTILLLDAALAYHREVTRQSSGMPESVQKLLPRLRDSRFTRVLIVTLPEATPVHEAAKLQRDLLRAGIQPFAWVVNQSLTPLVVTDPVLLARQAEEAAYLREVIDQQAGRIAILPWRKDPKV